jgi:outer membrane protein assembly factor BamB
VWQASTGGAISSTPALANGVVYVGSGDARLYAFTASTGALVWSGTTGGAVSSSPAVANGVVYVGSADTKVYAFAASCSLSCAPLWTGTTGGAVSSSPAVSNGAVYVGSGDDRLYEFNLVNGTPGVDWPAYMYGGAHASYSPAATAITPANEGSLSLAYRWIPDPPTMTGQPNNVIFASPTVVNHRIYIGAYTGVFYALDETTGATIWKQFLGFEPAKTCNAQGFVSTATVTTDPSTGKLTVYVASGDGNLYALDAAHGTVLWKSAVAIPSPTANDYFNWSSPTVVNNKIYVGVASQCDNPLVPGGVRMYDQATGTQLASYTSVPPGDLGAGVWSSVAATPDGVVIATTGNVANGSPRGDEDSFVRLHPNTLAKLDSWQVPLSSLHDSDFGGSPTIFYATINGVQTRMVGACNKNGVYYAMQAMHLSNGPVWQRQVGSPYNAQPGDTQCDAGAAWDGTHLFVASNNTTINGVAYKGGIRELDPATGAVIWETGLAATVLTTPTLNGSGLLGLISYDFTSTANSAYLVNAATGAATVLSTSGTRGFPQTVFADNFILVGTQGKGMFAYQAP